MILFCISNSIKEKGNLSKGKVNLLCSLPGVYFYYINEQQTFETTICLPDYLR